MIVGGVVVETGLEKVIRGVKEQGRVVRRGDDRGGGGLGGGLGWGGLAGGLGRGVR